ncbi:hypothetical protein VTN49DRAFT_1503 [Thermomyces lanuginosus]|uniref:uncharacterized protein n=1 Tax=Thermomyces lanuginosus TaxID=5541 RepID=UPI003744AA66
MPTRDKETWIKAQGLSQNVSRTKQREVEELRGLTHVCVLWLKQSAEGARKDRAENQRRNQHALPRELAIQENCADRQGWRHLICGKIAPPAPSRIDQSKRRPSFR